MKIILFLTLSLFALGGFNIAIADTCGGGLPKLITADIKTLLNGNTVCTSDSQEQHRGGVESEGVLSGQLWDYKRGSDPIDRTSQVGSWSVSNDKVRYTYGSSNFDNDVYSDGTNVCFDNRTTKISATIMGGTSGPCPGFPE
jgi:hypothetical protein